MSDADPQNRRRSQRVLLQIAVLFEVEMADGRRIRSQAFTQVVNAHGGLFDAPLRFDAGQRLTLINLKSGERTGCRVVRVGKPSDGCFPTAFEFDSPSPHFWPISFPPVDWGVSQEVEL